VREEIGLQFLDQTNLCVHSLGDSPAKDKIDQIHTIVGQMGQLQNLRCNMIGGILR
jgi:hypothetical protein